VGRTLLSDAVEVGVGVALAVDLGSDTPCPTLLTLGFALGVAVARVGRTLLSDALEVGVDVAFLERTGHPRSVK
jgi:hypothetical protein